VIPSLSDTKLIRNHVGLEQVQAQSFLQVCFVVLVVDNKVLNQRLKLSIRRSTELLPP
jgi:hypothetical protein